jgi:branched-subunit amino acid transport protein
MTPWLVVAAAGVGSYLLRVSMLVLAARRGVPGVVQRAARFATPTAFAALAATAVAHSATVGDNALAPFAAVVAAVVAVERTGSPRAALLAGLPTLWLVGLVSW